MNFAEGDTVSFINLEKKKDKGFIATVLRIRKSKIIRYSNSNRMLTFVHIYPKLFGNSPDDMMTCSPEAIKSCRMLLTEKVK